MTNPLEVLDEEALLKNKPDIAEQLQDLEKDIEAEKGEEPELDEMSDKELVGKVDEMNEGTLAFLKEKIKNGTALEKQRAALQLGIFKDMSKLLKKVNVFIDQEKPKKAEKVSIEFLEKTIKRLEKAKIGDEQIATAILQLQELINVHTELAERTVGKENLGLSLISNGVEVIYFVSGPKMWAESLYGKTLDGRKLSIGGRLYHALWGGIWTVVDAVGLGASAIAGGASASAGAFGVTAVVKGGKLAKIVKVGSAIMKGSKVTKGAKGSKAAAKSAKVAKAAKTAKGSRAMMKTGKFLLKHPRLAKTTVIAARGGDFLSKGDDISDSLGLAKTALKSLPKAKLFREMQEKRQAFISTLDSVLSNAA
jgi:hypothetical protein